MRVLKFLKCKSWHTIPSSQGISKDPKSISLSRRPSQIFFPTSEDGSLGQLSIRYLTAGGFDQLEPSRAFIQQRNILEPWRANEFHK